MSGNPNDDDGNGKIAAASSPQASTAPDGDTAHCYWAARRAVARAALHLGVRSVTAEALDGAAGCLLAYLERFGAALAHSVEASGRSSQHCHVLDAVRAAELCAAPAAVTAPGSRGGGVGATGGGGAETGAAAAAVSASEESANGGTTQSAGGHPHPHHHAAAPQSAASSWRDLAAFCFGPDWDREPVDGWASAGGRVMMMNGGDGGGDGGDEAHRSGGGVLRASTGIGGAGKVGPSAALGAGGAAGGVGGGGAGGLGAASGGGGALLHSSSNNNSSGLRKGWRAPYPDELPAFPICSAAVANPHPMAVPPSLHSTAAAEEEEDEEQKQQQEEEQRARELEEVPDAVFAMTTGWGRFGASTEQDSGAAMSTAAAVGAGEKRKAVDSEKDTPERPPAKRVRIAEDAIKNMTTVKATRRPSMPSYVPAFYPPFPSQLEARTVVDSTTDAVTAGAASALKSAKTAATTTAEPATANNESAAAAAAASPLLPTQSVRSALVKLGPYWGSLRSGDDDGDNHAAVPAGRPRDGAAAGASIVPLARASGSRVSRILEGSMEPPVMN